MAKIQVFSSQKDLKVSKKSVRALVQATLDHERSNHSEVAIYFVTESKICKMHQEHFDDPTTTDCISFPHDEVLLGEVVVCPKTAIIYANKHDLDPYEELSLYVIHGLLHCLGYDDLSPKERSIMRKKEKSCMAQVKKLNALLTP